MHTGIQNELACWDNRKGRPQSNGSPTGLMEPYNGMNVDVRVKSLTSQGRIVQSD